MMPEAGAVLALEVSRLGVASRVTASNDRNVYRLGLPRMEADARLVRCTCV